MHVHLLNENVCLTLVKIRLLAPNFYRYLFARSFVKLSLTAYLYDERAKAEHTKNLPVAFWRHDSRMPAVISHSLTQWI